MAGQAQHPWAERKIAVAAVTSKAPMTRFDFTVFAPVETGIRRLECRARRNPIAAAKPQQEVPSVWKILHRKIHRAPADAEPGSGLKPRTTAYNPKRTM